MRNEGDGSAVGKREMLALVVGCFEKKEEFARTVPHGELSSH